MSDNSHDQAHEAHTGPIKNAKQLVWASIASFVVPVFIIIGLVNYVTSANKEAPGSTDTDKAVAVRIQKIGAVEVRDANRPLKSGEEVYTAQCAACHASGAGADRAWWPVCSARRGAGSARRTGCRCAVLSLDGGRLSDR